MFIRAWVFFIKKSDKERKIRIDKYVYINWFKFCFTDDNPEEYDVSQLDPTVLSVIEADSFWCLSKLLDGIQDNYTFAQPGIQRQVATLKDLVSRIDGI